jgi:hypothetical protein
MNLIEQLGGYEAAKAESEARHRSEIAPCELDRQLLEYRRANNIYEIGDKVVGIRLIDDRIFEFQYELPEISMAVISKDGAAIGMNQLRHATDAEIEAGKRLEVV